MRRDMDLIRALVLERDTSGWTEEQVREHNRLAHEKGLRDEIVRVTNEGHDFAALCASDEAWAYAKSRIARVGGSAPFDIWRQLLIHWRDKRLYGEEPAEMPPCEICGKSGTTQWSFTVCDKHEQAALDAIEALKQAPQGAGETHHGKAHHDVVRVYDVPITWDRLKRLMQLVKLADSDPDYYRLAVVDWSNSTDERPPCYLVVEMEGA